jgi:Protein of unknown function (DUF3089)
LARKFLYLVAILIMIGVGVRIAWVFYSADLIKFASVPREAFVAPAPIAPNAYAKADLWIARPGLANSPADWLPKGAVAATKPRKAAVFFIHPTSYLFGKRWNAPLEDADSADRAALFVRGQASVFNAVGEIWAPRYRQATFGAFLTDKPEAKQAIDAAYADVALAFDQFLIEAGDRPIILAGHSQGALHLLRLIHDKVAGKPVQGHIVAAYIIGWPISVEADVPAMGLSACTRADQKGCIISYQSFAEPADYADVIAAFEGTQGLNGERRTATHILCTNPLTGLMGGEAPASANLGMLKNEPDFSGGALIAGQVPARCDDRGILLIGKGPELGPYVLPGNNYHVFDYSLFWANLRVDAARRMAGKR